MSRKILYYFPHLNVEKELNLPDGTLKPYKNEYEDLGGRHKDFNNGSLLSLVDFKSGGVHDESIDIRVDMLVELIKFSYFTKSPSISMDINGFISSETFDMFKLMETNKDHSFEHKVKITNGMYVYLHKLDDFLIYRKKTALNSIVVCDFSFDFNFTGTLDDFEDKDNLYSIIRLYNKAWESSTPLNAFLDKPILAKTSIEMLTKYNGYKANNFVDPFFESVLDFVKEESGKNKFCADIFKLISPYLTDVKENISFELLQLKDSRDKLIHSGEENIEFVTLPFYLIWFPIYFAITINRKKLTLDHVYRFLLFLCLCKFRSCTWNKSCFDLKSLISKHTHLYLYKLYSNIFPKINLDEEKQSAYLESIENWINEN